MSQHLSGMADLESGVNTLDNSGALQKEADLENLDSPEQSVQDEKNTHHVAAADAQAPSTLVDWDGPNDPEFPQNL